MVLGILGLYCRWIASRWGGGARAVVLLKREGGEFDMFGNKMQRVRM